MQKVFGKQTQYGEQSVEFADEIEAFASGVPFVEVINNGGVNLYQFVDDEYVRILTEEQLLAALRADFDRSPRKADGYEE